MPVPARSTSHGDAPAALSEAAVDALYDFALTVTWDAGAARSSVVEGVREAAVDAELPDLFAAVRHAAVRRAPDPAAVEIDVSSELPPPSKAATLEGLSLGVVHGLDPDDRAVLDLSLRQGLQGEDLARAVGLDPSGVTARVVDARERAEHLLTDYVLARIEFGACPGLTEALSELRPGLRRLAEAVDEHLHDCAPCEVRRRSLESPAHLLATIPTRPAPPEVAEELAAGADEAVTSRGGDRRRRLRALVVALLVLSAGAWVGARVVSGLGNGTADGAEGPADSGPLRAESGVDFGRESDEEVLTLSNRSAEDTTFAIETDVAWLGAAPDGGTVPASGSIEVTLTLARDEAPEGRATTTARVITDQGTLDVDVTVAVSRPPALADVGIDPAEIAVAPCEGSPTTALVSATATDEAGLASVVLRRSRPLGEDHDALADDGGDLPDTTEVEMEPGDADTHTAELGAFEETGTVLYVVEATDNSGNATTSERGRLTVSDCETEEETTDSG